jgi:tetratricopeptide (TPR) repeat protein
LTDKSRLAEAARKLEAEIQRALPDQHEFYSQLAGAFRESGDMRKAQRYYLEALRRKPGDVSTASALADLLLQRGRTAEAIQVLEHAGAKSSTDPALLNGLAVAYGRASRFTEAELLVRRAVDADEDLPLSWLNLGVCLQAQNKVAEAAAAYRQALRLQPDFQEARVYLSTIVVQSK